ncbi:MAG: M48 family metallopeptidase [Prevotella sp.]|nr:M48 family metallopeptidase [Prevotella sp.]
MKAVRIIIMSLVATILVGCGTTSTVPITGRKQTLLVNDGEVLSLANQQYQQYMQSAKASSNATNTAMVKRVGQNLANAVVSYLNANGLGAEVQNYAWEFNLVQDNQVNAWCMPGGKIVVYEGLLPVTQNEASLAIVLGHEIAHAVAKHSAERLSNEYKNQYGTAVLGAVLQGSGMSEGTQQLIALGQSLGGSLWTSGFSRSQESEADHMGLIFAAMAGYDPQVAVTFWQRMAAQSSGSSSIFSDHPSDAKRIKDIQGWMPEALKYYKPAATATTSGKSTTKATKTLKVTSKKK